MNLWKRQRKQFKRWSRTQLRMIKLAVKWAPQIFEHCFNKFKQELEGFGKRLAEARDSFEKFAKAFGTVDRVIGRCAECGFVFCEHGAERVFPEANV